MNPILVHIKKLAKDLPLPSYQSDLAAAVDLYAAVQSEFILNPGERAAVPTGIAIALPMAYEAQIRPRSGLAIKHGISMINTPGTIDADYRGEICVLLINHGKEPFVIRRGDRIAQMIVKPVPKIEFKELDELPPTQRGAGGYGSTGC
ncbi:MAG TPA: dUTP diphosphatase [Candidatus Nanoarchaeia archaeon]|nr:dUTP diphosphatase [Candidatus Nanoarchaeia archaeon]